MSCSVKFVAKISFLYTGNTKLTPKADKQAPQKNGTFFTSG